MNEALIKSLPNLKRLVLIFKQFIKIRISIQVVSNNSDNIWTQDKKKLDK